MANSNKTEQLGINYSTAAHRLRKLVLFKYIKASGDAICFQCGRSIDTPEELSIEHKIPWLHSEDPEGLFFDLDNVSFSHLSCNSAAARKPLKVCNTYEERLSANRRRKKEARLRWSEEEKDKQASLRREKYLRTGT